MSRNKVVLFFVAARLLYNLPSVLILLHAVNILYSYPTRAVNIWHGSHSSFLADYRENPRLENDVLWVYLAGTLDQWGKNVNWVPLN